MIVLVQAPQGASLDYTRDLCAQAEALLGKIPEIRGAFTIVGFGLSGTAPNRGMIFADLKDFRERKGQEHSGATVVERLRGQIDGYSRRTRRAVQSTCHRRRQRSGRLHV